MRRFSRTGFTNRMRSPAGSASISSWGVVYLCSVYQEPIAQGEDPVSPTVDKRGDFWNHQLLDRAAAVTCGETASGRVPYDVCMAEIPGIALSIPRSQEAREADVYELTKRLTNHPHVL